MSLQNFLIMHLLFWLKDHCTNPTLMRFFLMNLKRCLLLPIMKTRQTVHVINGEDSSLQFLTGFIDLTHPFWGCHPNQLPPVVLPVFCNISVSCGLTLFHRKVSFEALQSVLLKALVSVIENRRAYINSTVLKEKIWSRVGQFAGSPGFSELPLSSPIAL